MVYYKFFSFFLLLIEILANQQSEAIHINLDLMNFKSLFKLVKNSTFGKVSTRDLDKRPLTNLVKKFVGENILIICASRKVENETKTSIEFGSNLFNEKKKRAFDYFKRRTKKH